ncbi:hypothetical protein P8452_73531 [Trifolium repens]|nr:hypothetical protein P8452_73531 [Trifolium repens]
MVLQLSTPIQHYHCKWYSNVTSYLDHKGMAEQIPYAVAASLINRLGSAALLEYGRINGVMNELERLKKTVESIRAVLLDAEDKQEEQNHAVQNWKCYADKLACSKGIEAWRRCVIKAV